MIYILAHSHSPFWFSKPSIFLNRRKQHLSIRKLKKEADRSDEEFIKSFKRKYADPLPPSWMILEISSFGNLSNLYKNLNPGRDKRNIAHYFGLDDSTFESWLHSFTYVRNVCAHHSRFWNKRMSIQPRIPTSPYHPFVSITHLPSPRPGGSTWRINDLAPLIRTGNLQIHRNMIPCKLIVDMLPSTKEKQKQPLKITHTTIIYRTNSISICISDIYNTTLRCPFNCPLKFLDLIAPLKVSFGLFSRKLARQISYP